MYLWLVCGCWKGCGSRIKCLPAACKWLLKGMWWQNKMCTCGLYVAAERDVVAENTFAAAEKIFGFQSSWLRPAHDVHFKFVNFYICAFLHASICCQYNVSEFFFIYSSILGVCVLASKFLSYFCFVVFKIILDSNDIVKHPWISLQVLQTKEMTDKFYDCLLYVR